MAPHEAPPLHTTPATTSTNPPVISAARSASASDRGRSPTPLHAAACALLTRPTCRSGATTASIASVIGAVIRSCSSGRRSPAKGERFARERVRRRPTMRAPTADSGRGGCSRSQALRPSRAAPSCHSAGVLGHPAALLPDVVLARLAGVVRRGVVHTRECPHVLGPPSLAQAGRRIRLIWARSFAPRFEVSTGVGLARHYAGACAPRQSAGSGRVTSVVEGWWYHQRSGGSLPCDRARVGV